MQRKPKPGNPGKRNLPDGRRPAKPITQRQSNLQSLHRRKIGRRERHRDSRWEGRKKGI
jgi:hypothetical protein